jgi:hypothetical protein
MSAERSPELILFITVYRSLYIHQHKNCSRFNATWRGVEKSMYSGFAAAGGENEEAGMTYVCYR